MEAKVEILPLLTIGSQTEVKQNDNNFTVVAQIHKTNVNLLPLATIGSPVEFKSSKFVTKAIREPIPPINLLPLAAILSTVEIIKQKCFDVESQYNEADKIRSVCKSKSKNSVLYDAISRINEETVLEFLYDSDLNPFFHYMPYLCGNTQRVDCKTSVNRCSIKESSYWANNKISIQERAEDKESDCEINTNMIITNEYLSTLSYLAMFYKNRIPFNPKNIDYYLQCLGYLEYDKTSFDIICVRKDYYTNISKDILYRDWQKMSQEEQDKYIITNTIYIYPQYRSIVESDISPRQGKYSINSRVSFISISKQVKMVGEEYLNRDEIVESLSEEIERIERIADIEEYQEEVNKLEEIKKSIEYLLSKENDNSDRVSLVDMKLNEFAKIVSDAFEAI